MQDYWLPAVGVGDDMEIRIYVFFVLLLYFYAFSLCRTRLCALVTNGESCMHT